MITPRFKPRRVGFCSLFGAVSLAIVAAALAIVPASAQSEEQAFDIQVRVCPDGGYESGCDREDITDAVLASAALAADLAGGCLFQTRARCAPLAHGFIPAPRQGGTIMWQLMGIQPKDGPYIEMLVIIEAPDDGPPNVLAARQTEGWFGPPERIEDSAELLMIHAPGRTGGTGAGNADVVLTRHQQGWTTFDVNTLLEQASAMLPAGFSLAGGADFDFREMHAYVPVKRQGDGGCCATGGMAHLDLGLPQPNWMQVDSVTFEETTPVRTHRLTAPDPSAASTPD